MIRYKLLYARMYTIGSIHVSPSSTCHVTLSQIINFYFNLIVSECNKMEQHTQVHTFTTHFHPKLYKNGYEGVRKWTKHVSMLLSTYPCLSSPSCMQDDIFECSLALIAIHSGCHWSLVVVDYTKEAIEYYDSLRGSGAICIARIWCVHWLLATST